MLILQKNPEVWSNVFCLANLSKTLIFYQEDNLILYDLEGEKIITKIPHKPTELFQGQICLSYDDRYCCVIVTQKEKPHGGKLLLRFDLENQKLIDYIEPYHLMDVCFLKFAHNTYTMASLSKDSTIKFMDISTNKPKTYLTRFEEHSTGFDIIQNNKNFIITDNKFNLRIKNCQTERLVKKLQIRKGRCLQSSTAQNGISIFLQTSHFCFHYELARPKIVRKFAIQSPVILRQSNQIFLLKNEDLEKIDVRTGKTKSIQVLESQIRTFGYFDHHVIISLSNEKYMVLEN